ncbi:MAG TPA: dihydroorotate dehydrogenase, partial [Gammaproteobacteria bacterium]|nr:dihydroorotate dehydrogenase [Gammaproteobacteria bacterium]
GTALFYDPLICNKLNRGIVDYLDRHKLDSVRQLTGSLTLNAAANSPGAKD